eukprot:1215420-Amphidinium_carterae.2
MGKLQLESDAVSTKATGYAFAALKSTGMVVTWGDANRGGDSSQVKERLQDNVETICSTRSASHSVLLRLGRKPT